MGLGGRGGLPGQDRAGGGDRIDDIGLAVAAPDLPVRPHHLHDRDLFLTQVSGQRDTVSPGALDAALVELTEGPHPREQTLVAGRGRGELGGAQDTSDDADDCSNVHIEVSVDATGDDRA